MGSGETCTTRLIGRFVCETTTDTTEPPELDEGHPLEGREATREWRTWHDLATGRRVHVWRLEWR